MGSVFFRITVYVYQINGTKRVFASFIKKLSSKLIVFGASKLELVTVCYKFILIKDVTC